MVTTKEFGKMADGKVVNMYSISNSKGFQADVINYGAILVNLFVEDKNGIKRDVVLGYDKLEDYYDNAFLRSWKGRGLVQKKSRSQCFATYPTTF